MSHTPSQGFKEVEAEKRVIQTGQVTLKLAANVLLFPLLMFARVIQFVVKRAILAVRY